MRCRAKKGFTLVEIMIVVAIIATLATLSIPHLYRVRLTSEQVCVRHELRTINVAIVQYFFDMSFGSKYNSRFFKEALERANQKGVLLVAAAGNSNSSNPSYPAAYDNVIAVGSTNQTGKRSWFSNFGDYVDMVAQGQSVNMPYFGGTWRKGSGTSFAAPYVAGMAALLLSFFPQLLPAQVEAFLKARSMNVDDINGRYSGMLGSGFLGDGQLKDLLVEFAHRRTATPSQGGGQVSRQGSAADLSDEKDTKWLVRRTYQGATFILRPDGSVTVIKGGTE